MILRDWDRRVTHSSIPLITEDVPEDMFDVEETEASDVLLSEDEFFAPSAEDRQDNWRRGAERGSFSSRRSTSLRSQRVRRPSRGYGSGYGGGDDDDDEEGGGSYLRRGGGGSVRRGNSFATYTWDGITPHVLFRYFDYNVQPGHRYRYRVRLALADCNHDVLEMYLDKTVTERRSKIKKDSLKTYNFTDWSEPSPVASVPLPARVYLASAETANESNYNDEPEANILVKVFNSELPAEIAIKESFLRGSVLNVEEKPKVIWADRANRDTNEWNEKFVFRTGITVVDFRGGKRLSSKNRDLTVPARVVLMDPAGHLFLQNELDDSESVTEFQDAIEGNLDGLSPYGGRSDSFESEGWYDDDDDDES
ncbi:MAG: hypothetical protein IH898_05370 [Planctomycetes bacterium]|nr:hypothetical protein [Planctomycetota bacterium]